MTLWTNMPSKFLGGGRLPVPVPVLGAELLTNGTFAADANWIKNAGWTIAGGVGVCTAATSSMYQNSIHATGTWYLASFEIVTMTVAGGGFYPQLTSTIINPAKTTVGTHVWTYRADSDRFRISSGSPVVTGTVDNASVKAITLASMFSTRPYSTHVTVKAQATVVAGTRAGVVCNLDSATAPANFVLASHDGTTARLTKCVAGTYTELISTAVTYAAGAFVEIRRPAAGNNWQLFYNGSQVGTDQAIADTAIQNATLAGMFNTFSSNQLTGFSCVPS